MQKRTMSMLVVLAMVFALGACSSQTKTGRESSDSSNQKAGSVTDGDKVTEGKTNEGTASKRGFKVGIMAHSVTYGEENYRYSMNKQKEYGSDYVIVDTYPDKADQETVISKVLAMAADPNVKVIMFNIADAGTIAAINALKEKRSDIITICGNPVEDIEQVAAVADLVLMKDHNNLAKNMVMAAVAAGCKTFVHYSFPRHMSSQVVALRAQVFKESCKENGITYVEATAPDPNSDAGVAGTQQFILEDVPAKVEEYGENTCFFGTQASMYEPMIKMAVKSHAMFFGQSDPTPIDAYPAALGIKVPENKIGDISYMHEQIAAKATELGMNSRLGAWNQSVISMLINCGFDIGSAYELGEISKVTDFDYISSFIKNFGGEGTTVNYYITAKGTQVDNVILYCSGTRIY